MRNVAISIRLKINLTAQDWQLFTSKAGADKAAYAMNVQLEPVINEAKNFSEALTKGAGVLANFREFGSTDSEPYAVLEQLLELRFGTE